MVTIPAAEVESKKNAKTKRGKNAEHLVCRFQAEDGQHVAPRKDPRKILKTDVYNCFCIGNCVYYLFEIAEHVQVSSAVHGLWRSDWCNFTRCWNL